MSSFALPAAMMIASGSVHAIVNAIVKGGREAGGTGPVLGSIMAARAMTDGASAAILLPAVLLVPPPTGAWGWLAASAAVHVVYLYTMIRAYAAADF